MATDAPAFLSIDQVALRWSVSRTYVYDLLSRGVLPHVDFGAFRRVPLAAIETYEAERTKTHSDAPKGRKGPKPA